MGRANGPGMGLHHGLPLTRSRCSKGTFEGTFQHIHGALLLDVDQVERIDHQQVGEVLVIFAGRFVAAQPESVFIDGIVDKALDHRFPAGNQRVVDPQPLTGLEQSAASPFKQGQVEVAVLEDAQSPASRSAAGEAFRPRPLRPCAGRD